MSRREALGFVLAVMLVLAGQLVRHALMVDPAGGWREPGWLESTLPPVTDPATPAHRKSPALARRPSTPLDPNTCPVDSLVLLPGIGPALATRIVEARASGVHFACARDLQEIRGIGPKLSARITSYLVFAVGDSADSGPLQPASGAGAAPTRSGQNPSRPSGGDR